MLQVDKTHPMSEEFYNKLMAAFRPLEVKPETSRENVMYNAGQQSVLTWVSRYLKRKPAEYKPTFFSRVKAAFQLIWRGYAD